MRQNEALDKILCCEGSWMELIFSSLNGIRVPEKNIGYEFLFRLHQREIYIQYFFSVRYRKSNEQKSKTLLGSIRKA